MFGFLQTFFTPAQKHDPRRTPSFKQFRPTLESLEGREVPSATMLSPNLGAAQVAAANHRALSIVPLKLTSVVTQVQDNVTSLLANAGLGNATTQIPLSLSTRPGQSPRARTQILNLHVGAIHLDLLGLKVDTSEICLKIFARRGPGNLLGNLLVGVAGALDRGTSLSDVLGSLNATQLGTLTSGLRNLLNGALGQLTTPTNVARTATVSSNGTTQILHLSVGPLNLNLLGLHVRLDNCNNGPVTVDISAESGDGKLLGNLFRSIANLLNGPGRIPAVTRVLTDIAELRLLGL